MSVSLLERRLAVHSLRRLAYRPSYSPLFVQNTRFASVRASRSSPNFIFRQLTIVAGAASIFGFFSFYSAPVAEAEAPSAPRTIRLSEVKAHGAKAERRWVVKGTRVYDITDWIPNHPGGEVILRAVGGVIDPYWEIFTIHKKKDVYEILEQYYLGDLDPRDLVDGKVPSDDIEDPFQNDPRRDPRLVVHSDRPFNAETAPADLGTFITPNATFYVRHHLWVPQIDPQAHKLQIELPDGEELEYSMEELKSKVGSRLIMSIPSSVSFETPTDQFWVAAVQASHSDMYTSMLW